MAKNFVPDSIKEKALTLLPKTFSETKKRVGKVAKASETAFDPGAALEKIKAHEAVIKGMLTKEQKFLAKY